jgi:hypothetical protein
MRNIVEDLSHVFLGSMVRYEDKMATIISITSIAETMVNTDKGSPALQFQDLIVAIRTIPGNTVIEGVSLCKDLTPWPE